MDPADLMRLDAKADEYGCYVSTVKRTRAPAGWVVRAFGRSNNRGVRVEVRTKGTSDEALEAAIAAVLEDYREAALYTGEELVQIQRQSV